MQHNLESIAIFSKVVEQKSFTLAARLLRISPSLVSKHISRLEEDLGVLLFRRSKRQLHLTEYGVELYQRSARALFELDDAQSSLRGKNLGMKGVLRVHVTQGIGERLVERAVAAFMKRNDNLVVELSISADIVNPLDRGLDLAIRSGGVNDAHMMHSSLAFRELGEARYVICAAKTYLDVHGAPKHPKELIGYNCLIHYREGLPRAWRFTGPEGEYTVPVSGTLVSNSHSMVHEAALAGIGIARFLAFGAENLAQIAGLVSLFDGLAISDRIVRAFYPRGGPSPEKVTTFLDLLADQIILA